MTELTGGLVTGTSKKERKGKKRKERKGYERKGKESGKGKGERAHIFVVQASIALPGSESARSMASSSEFESPLLWPLWPSVLVFAPMSCDLTLPVTVGRISRRTMQGESPTPTNGLALELSSRKVGASFS